MEEGSSPSGPPIMSDDNDNKVVDIKWLKENLRLSLSMDRYTYYESMKTQITIKLILGDEVISEVEDYVSS